MEKKVTIVIPNYNGLNYMEECFAALENQTCRDFQVLVVDNGSQDGSVEWLKEKQIPSIFLPENTGFTGAVNTGLKACTSPLMGILGLRPNKRPSVSSTELISQAKLSTIKRPVNLPISVVSQATSLVIKTGYKLMAASAETTTPTAVKN